MQTFESEKHEKIFCNTPKSLKIKMFVKLSTKILENAKISVNTSSKLSAKLFQNISR